MWVINDVDEPLFQATLIFDLLLDSAESQSISFLSLGCFPHYGYRYI